MNRAKTLVVGPLQSSGAAATYSIAGVVYDTDGSTPIPGATITLGELTDTSGADGSYSFADLPAGTSGSMTCTLAGYSWTAITVEAMSGNLTAQNYTATVSLYANWVLGLNMNETSGNRLDSSGNSHDAVDVGVVGYAAGKVLSAAKAENAAARYLYIPYHADFALGTADWWMSVWVYVVDLTGWRNYIFQALDPVVTDWALWLDTTSSKFRFGKYNAGLTVLSDVTISADAWYNVQFGHDDGNDFISVNGETRVQREVASITDSNVRMGIFGIAYEGNGSADNTLIDRVYRWNTAWTPEAGALDYNSGSPEELEVSEPEPP